MEKSKNIYLDYASATPIDVSVIEEINKSLVENFANPGSIHTLGMNVKNKLEKVRGEIAKIIVAHPDEIIFTSGATESNNLAIKGVLENYFKNFQQIPHIVTTNIEHSSVLEVYKYLEINKLAEVTFVPVEKNGIVDSKKIKKALKSNTVLVSVMYANNEIGTIQPIREIAKEIRLFQKTFKNKTFPLFHTDATQAVNYLPIGVERLGIDLMSFNGGKIYGPKGVGILYVKRKTPISKILFGGGQEIGVRPGTENLPLIIGVAKALEITEKVKEKESERLLMLRNYFIKELFNSKIFAEYKIILNGDFMNRLPNNVNITVPKIPSDLLVLELSARGIYISEKSACKSGEKTSSYVIRAITCGNKTICKKNEGSLRFSLGRKTTKADIDDTLKSLDLILAKLKKWYN